MKKITKKLIILFGIILINTLPLAAQGGGGPECIGDNLMELQFYGYGSCQDLLSAGYPIGADSFLDQLCCETFSGYSNDNCPGDNMEFVNFNLGVSSCSEFFALSGYPIGADPTIDQMCCGTISGGCTDNVNEINNMGFANCSDFLSMTGYPIGADPYIEDICCGTISSQNSGCTDNVMELQNYGFGSCQDLLADGYPIGYDPMLDELCCETFDPYLNGECPGDNNEFINLHHGLSGCSEFIEVYNYTGGDPLIDLICCGSLSGGNEIVDCDGVVNGSALVDDCGDCISALVYDYVAHEVLGSAPTADVELGPNQLFVEPNHPSNPYWNANCVSTLGCMDPNALNFNYMANEDDGSCEYDEPHDCGEETIIGDIELYYEANGPNSIYVHLDPNDLDAYFGTQLPNNSELSETFIITSNPTVWLFDFRDFDNVIQLSTADGEPHNLEDGSTYGGQLYSVFACDDLLNYSPEILSIPPPVQINNGESISLLSVNDLWELGAFYDQDNSLEELIITLDVNPDLISLDWDGTYDSNPIISAVSGFIGSTEIELCISDNNSTVCAINEIIISGDNNQSDINYGHYGPGGSDSVLWDPDLVWTCNGCNGLDLIDADTVMGMSTNMFVGICYNLDAYSTDPMDNESCMAMDYPSVWVGFNNEYVCEDNEDELIYLMTDGMTSDEIDMQMQMINDAGGACNFVIPFAFGDPLLENLCCESISNFDPSDMCESGDCIQDCYGMWLDHSAIQEFYGNSICDDFMNCEIFNFDGGDCGNFNTYLGTWEIQSWIQEGEEGITDDANAYFNFYEWGDFSVGFNDQINFGQFQVSADNEIIIMPSPDESITFSVYEEGDMIILTDVMGGNVITLMATESIFGCLDSNNPAYNQDANAMDYSTCEIGCFDENACNFGQSDAVYCDYNCCTNPNACNFGEEADCEVPEYSCDCDGNIPDYSNVGWEVDLVAINLMENSDVHIIGYWHDSSITSEIYVNLQHGWDNTFVGNFDGPPNATFSYYVVVDGVEYGNCNGEPYQIGFNDLDYDNPCMVWNNTNAISPNNCAEMYDCNGLQYNEVQWIDQAYSLIGNGECESDWIGWYTFNCEEFDYESGDCSPDNCNEYIEIDVPLELSSGWNMIGYTCWEPINAIDAFTDISNKIEIVKDGWGMAYIPDWEFNGLGNFEYGKGYQIKMFEDVNDFQFCKTIIRQ